jgi:hypothetical protein
MAVRRGPFTVAAALLLVLAIFAARWALSERALDRLAHAPQGARTGSWHLPRGGPYIFGFESPGPAQLWVGGRLVASGQGEVSSRVIFPAGVQPVRFVGPQGARLLWHPPGRRGALEYLPPSSVSPEPPERATFGAGAGAWRLEAAAVTAILLVIVTAALFVLRPRVPRRTLLVLGGVFALALAARWIGLAAFGQTWDEDEYWSAGRNYLVNLVDLDFRGRAWRWNQEHPPVTKYLAGLGALWQDGYGVARALFALVGAGTCALVTAIGARLFGERAGLLAGIAAALFPRLVAHDQIVGHEAPSLFLWALALWLAVRLGEVDDNRALARRAVVLGAVVGLAAGTRFANVLLLPVVGAALLVATPRSRLVRVIDLGCLLVPSVGAATFVAIWPRMWIAPGKHLSAAWSVLKRQHLPERYLGEIVQQPDWHYFPTYVLATTPVLVLLGAFLLGGWRVARRRELGMLLPLALLVVPLGVAYSPVRQDGVRYVLPIFLGLVLFAGAGLDAVARRRTALHAGALVLYLAVTFARVHPYPLDYFAEHVGGSRTVAARRWFEVGWWGEGIGEAVAHVNAHASPGARVYRLLQPTHLNWFRHDLWADTTPEGADWLVVNDAGLDAAPLFGQPPFRLPADATLVHEVMAQGASLVRVYRRVPTSDVR